MRSRPPPDPFCVFKQAPPFLFKWVMVSSSSSIFSVNLLLLFSVLVALVAPPPVAAVLDSSILPQPPTAVLDEDHHDEAEPLGTTPPAAAAEGIKASADRLQEAIQDIPLEDTPLGMAAASGVPSPSPSVAGPPSGL